MTNPHPGRPRPTVGISTFVPSLATTVEVGGSGVLGGASRRALSTWRF